METYKKFNLIYKEQIKKKKSTFPVVQKFIEIMIKHRINKIFKIIGAAAAAANLLWEFKIADKKEASEIKSKKGKVSLVKFIANCIFSLSSLNPGAIIFTNPGMKISIRMVVTNRKKTNKYLVKTSFLKENNKHKKIEPFVPHHWINT